MDLPQRLPCLVDAQRAAVGRENLEADRRLLEQFAVAQYLAGAGFWMGLHVGGIGRVVVLAMEHDVTVYG